MYGRKGWHISAYQYKADIYCPDCIVEAVDSSPELKSIPKSLTITDPEVVLTQIAAANGIDRFDENSFDSDDFPKVVFSSQIEDEEHCSVCNEEVY